MISAAHTCVGRAGLFALASLLGACGGESPPRSQGPESFPAPLAPPAETVQPSDFAGAEPCAECHAEQYSAWARSTHGRAGGEPGPRVVIAPFDGRAIRFADATVIPRIRGGSYEFVVRQDHFEEQVFPVVGVIGRAHMLGGGTQGFLTLLEDGTERFLPWDWSGGAAVWFCNSGSRLDRGWVPIDETMSLWACGDWPPVRPIGTVDRFANCQECHGSQIQTRFDPGTTAYETTYTTLQVNCESCHGPAARHVEMARAGTFVDSDIGLASLAWMEKDASLGVCFRCHGLKDVVREGYLPGDPFEEHFALKFPVLGDRPYFADARVRSFAYQATHLASACYLEGPMDCVSCHEPHGQGYWDINRAPLASPFDDGQCTACHQSKAIEPERHTFHAPGSEGSRCVSCHMPYLQHPEVGPGVPFARSDHTIPVPRPAFDASLGITSACAGCHEDRSSEALERSARAWWGELKPQRPLVQAQLSDSAGIDLLRPDLTDPLLQFQALSRFLLQSLGPDLPSLPPETRSRLEGLARSPDLDVRALALAALHWSRGDDPAVRDLLVRALVESDAPSALRGRWVLALGFLGDQNRDAGSYARAERAYDKALEIEPGSASVWTALGQLHNQTGNSAAAVRAFRESLTLDPNQPVVLVNLALALEGANDPAGARTTLEQATRLNPHEPLAWFNLGNLHQRAGRLDDAVLAYQRATASDPGLGRGWFELGRTLFRLERFPEALQAARRAVEFMPDHAPSRQMMEDLERALPGR